MKILLDTASTAEIKRAMEVYSVVGVTTNPTIIAKENTDFFPLLKEIRQLLGPKRELHVQLTGANAAEMWRETQRIWDELGQTVYIKIPTNREGLIAMRRVKEAGGRVTATAVYGVPQALLAAYTGADYVAPYINRMQNLDIDSIRAVEQLALAYRMHGLETNILAASFKNAKQVIDALLAGAHAVTVGADILDTIVENNIITGAIDGFMSDWRSVYGEKKIYEF
ncbi:MAG: fructose-6-phosphate aldolase [Lachnospiraceae bacterium]|nr:fructose-6-phosphate aldolase [Lachnospiraceae bacterium]MDY5742754.1 fructose-6-phosphate aldolase [Lachnospiraceae bacterium]